MRTVQLGQTGLTASVLGFGGSGLMGRSGRADSLRALAAAWEAGITLYDTARCYGYGDSEALLGEFLRGRRGQAIISTKFGITPSRQYLWKRAAKPVARAMLAFVPASRSVLNRMASQQITHHQFTLPALEESIHESLRQLKTDYIDILFMHDASADALGQGDLLLALEKLVTSGKVRVAGVSAMPEVIDLALSNRPKPLRAVQFPCNVFDLEAMRVLRNRGTHGFAAVANHPFGGVEHVQRSRSALIDIAKSPATPRDLRSKLGKVDDSVLADVVLNSVLGDSGIHVVVPAMMKVRHIRNNVNAIDDSRFTAAEIRVLRASLPGAAAGAM